MAKYVNDCGGFKPIVIPEKKQKATKQTAKKSTASRKATKKK